MPGLQAMLGPSLYCPMKNKSWEKWMIFRPRAVRGFPKLGKLHLEPEREVGSQSRERCEEAFLGGRTELGQCTGK